MLIKFVGTLCLHAITQCTRHYNLAAAAPAAVWMGYGIWSTVW